MKLTEDFIKNPEVGRTYNWGKDPFEVEPLKGDYSKERVYGEVVSYKLEGEELKKLLKRFENKSTLEVPRVHV